MKKKHYIIAFILLRAGCLLHAQPYVSQVWSPDLGNGSYKNPVLFADWSDPDVCRADDGYYLTASSFNCVPGLPVLHSADLVNWRIIGYALQKLTPEEVFDRPQHGNGVYAPCIRYRRGEFYIYWGDPDYGIYVVKTRDPAGRWDDPVLVKPGKGLIDPSPLFDDDGRVYLVHAWAGSRSRINSILSVCELNGDGTQVKGREVMVFDGLAEGNHTVEGAKFYKRDGYYYIFAPAGGVKRGWQLAMRSRTVFGPYEHKTVLEQGATDVNGPHQGGWVETPSGESWFLHFQDREAYGRVVHLQPVAWTDGWPEMGTERNGLREPVATYRKPDTGVHPPVENPAESDGFDQPALGLQWQWHANPKDPWCMTTNMGFLRLYAIPLPDGHANFWDVPNLLLQKFPAEEFTATAALTFSSSTPGEKTGLIVMGLDYSYIALSRSDGGYQIVQAVCRNADRRTPETVVAETSVAAGTVHLRVTVGKQALCRFAYSTDGVRFVPFGETFRARQGRWIGAKTGIFAVRPDAPGNLGYADFDCFRIERSFLHPGVLHTAEDMAHMRRLVADRTEPAYGSFRLLQEHRCSQAGYQMECPFRVISRDGEFRHTKSPMEADFSAACQNALMWTLTANEAHARKSLEILTACADSLTLIPETNDAPLLAGLEGLKIIYALEILKHACPGITDEQLEPVDRMFKTIFLPVMDNFYARNPYTNGNWGPIVTKAYMAAGIYFDNREMYDRGKNFYLHARDNGTVAHYIDGETGQLQESGRDQGHCMLGLGAMATVCEIAWKQGDDLYGALDNRLLRGFEYAAGYNLGHDVPFRRWTDVTGKYSDWPAISDKGRGHFKPVFEMPFNHYVRRKGLQMPYTLQVVEKIRPEGFDRDQPGFGTLLFNTPQ